MKTNLKFKRFSIALFFALGALVISSCTSDDDNPTPVDNSTQFTINTLLDGNGDVTETIVTIQDRGEGTGTVTLTRNRTWVLDGLVFVNSGQTLTIEEGTIIKGKSGQGENASALVVAKGATIMAQGSATLPIIMTAESDQIRRKADDSAYENGGNLPTTARGLWGGLIVLGDAILNSTPGQSAIEGIPTTESRGIYGGSNDADNSGVISYVSIRHGGTDIGAGNEINGLTLGGVGSGTTIDHVEIIANNDDGIEFFGGTARIKNAVVTLVGDDAIDYDEGWRGFIQYALVYQPGDRGGEHDGGTSPEDGTPYATPVIANVTSIGKGMAAGKRALTFRDNAGGQYWNSIFTEWGKGVDVEDLASGEDSRNRLEMNDLQYQNNIHWNVANNDAALQVVSSNGDDLLTHQNVVGNDVDNVMMLGVLPTSTRANTTNWPSGLDAFFTQSQFAGAFDPSGSDMWHEGWTLTDEANVIQ
ncbi:MAG: hypothetical protein KJO64_07800 [Bacteroidia bacterium]|nr:hypothetical protein [Bacteroidia bacterium]